MAVDSGSLTSRAGDFTRVRDRFNIELVVSTGIALSIFALAANAWFSTIREIVRDYVALPSWDYWDIAAKLADYRAFHFAVLWQQHNEHRIVFPELVFASDILWLDGRQMLPLAASFIAYFASWLLLSWTVVRDTSCSLQTRLLALALSGFIIGWRGSSAVLASPFLLQWTMVQLNAILALFCISRAAEKSKPLFVTAAIAAAVVGTFSSGNGLVLWPILLAAGFVLSLGRRYLVLIAASAAVTILLFFCGYQSGHNLRLSKVILHPAYALGFVSSYLSMPYGALKPTSVGVIVGIGATALVVTLFLLAYRGVFLKTPPAIVFLGFWSFIFLGALLTACGRIDTGDPDFTAAKAPRYITMPILGWAAIVLLLMWLADRLSWRLASPVVIAVIVTASLSIVYPKLRNWVRAVESDFATVRSAELSIESGLADPEMLGRLYPDPSLVVTLLPEFKHSRLSVYHARFTDLLAQPASTHFVLNKQASIGTVQYEFPVAGGVEIAGSTGAFRGRARVLVMDEQNRVIGFGRTLTGGMPRELPKSSIEANSGWLAFANLSSGAKKISTYLVKADGRTLVPLSAPFELSPLQPASTRNLGPVIENITWNTGSAWAENLLPPQANPGELPSKRFFASWSGADANTGQISSSEFRTPSSGCLILPVVHGPSVDRLSAQVLDARNRNVVAAIPLRDGDTHWRFWRISIKPDVPEISIVGRDAGTAWGQWLGIGEPAECR